MTDAAVTDLTRGVYRRLYGGFITGQRINKLSLNAEAWFWRVLVSVDDFGNGRADPELCRSATAGNRRVTSKQVSDWLREMGKVGLIRFYSNKGEPFLHVVGFEANQPAGRNGKRFKRFPTPDESKGIQVNPDLPDASEEEAYAYTDTEDDTEVGAQPRQHRKPQQCDSDFLTELQSDEAYQKLNVKQVHAKMVRWCKEKSKMPTRARLINWLNREDQPMEGSNGAGPPRDAAERNEQRLRDNLAGIEELRSEDRGNYH